ncbi:MAG: MBL fold metallo-hydrolase [Desulfobacterales bacterium]|jgi:hydroxyacylglutathione hydrolase|nr:MBL fold metallo-hydrolase [Desulfobacteraceae bacterium]MBT4364548.1 MBL fold metallo-hydrolase [Desulfobacteraceae bacterium]MBT7085940.1 MBL fold metallo-hydrolase [Desulfobacterales bacterium]MBT7696906.1 MBL fold metallo-hydrolase [Desulfobacterales bacterium]
MVPDIHTIKMGIVNCYLIKAERTMLIDSGSLKQVSAFIKAINKVRVKPEDIKLILITHGHWDHIESAKDIKEITGADIAMHENEAEWLEKALVNLPPAATKWGWILRSVMMMAKPMIKIPATGVDVVLNNENILLTEYGIPGRIIYTPGHSSGSVSLLLDTGDAFVGDLAMNRFPLRLSAGLPIFAEDIEKVKESWELLLTLGAKTIYPAHGKPFSSDVFRNAL